MRLTADPTTFVGFVLALVRASSWLVLSPPFNSRVIPVQVKIGLAGALALVAASSFPAASVPTDLASLIVAVVQQVATGLLLGFVTLILFSAVQAAGELVDLFSGLAISSVFDPLSNSTSSSIGRVYQLVAITLLFALDGHVMVVRGFLDSFEAVPASGLRMDAISTMLIRDLGRFFVAALEIAAPLLAALFLAEVALGLLARAAPQMNVFALGFSFKILLVLVLSALAIPLLPNAVGALLEGGVEGGGLVMRALPW